MLLGKGAIMIGTISYKTVTINGDFYSKTKTQSIYKTILDKMQELEAEDVDD